MIDLRSDTHGCELINLDQVVCDHFDRKETKPQLQRKFYFCKDFRCNESLILIFNPFC